MEQLSRLSLPKLTELAHTAWLDAYTELKGRFGIEKVPLFLALYSLHASLPVRLWSLPHFNTAPPAGNFTGHNPLPKESPAFHSWNLTSTTLSDSPELLFREREREREQTVNLTILLCATCDLQGSWLDENSQTVPKLLIKHPLPGFLIMRKVVGFHLESRNHQRKNN